MVSMGRIRECDVNFRFWRIEEQRIAIDIGTKVGSACFLGNTRISSLQPSTTRIFNAIAVPRIYIISTIKITVSRSLANMRSAALSPSRYRHVHYNFAFARRLAD